MTQAKDIVVIKFGSGILTRPDGMALDETQINNLISSVAALHQSGIQPIIVSSGAAAAGMMKFGFDKRPKNLSTLQACCAVGQTRLMQLYSKILEDVHLNVAQLLLDNEDFSTPGRRKNVLNTITTLIELGGVIPVINENDSVAVEELKFGDNDTLSAQIACLIEASLLILLTGVDGLKNEKGDIVSEVENIDEAICHVRPETGKFSVGGMATKLEAARVATASGIPVFIGNGDNPGQIPEIVAGAGIGTRFHAN
ncbi:MAG: glutamate 5-kinase [Verrucomicrobiales bacterium]|nr:glutamate 5-kinase [Verrucomicrobiales bacterium]